MTNFSRSWRQVRKAKRAAQRQDLLGFIFAIVCVTAVLCLIVYAFVVP